MSRRHRSTERRGFALIASLWLLVALAAVGLELSLQSRNRRLAAANVAEGAQARAAAEAGIEQARARLSRLVVSDPPPIQDVAGRGATVRRTDPWHDPATILPETLSVGPARVTVTLNDANGSINLNRAEEGELRRLFVALRIDAGDADRIAQAIADWRDPDDLTRPRGAERALYVREGLDVLPANAPFTRVSELRQVRGVTEEIYRLVRPYLTVAGTGMVNFNAAPRVVLLALDGMTDEAVWVLERAADAGRPIRSLDELQLALSPSARAVMQANLPALYARAAFETREVEVRSDAWMAGTPVRASASGLAVRAGTATFLIGRRGE